MCSIKVFLRKPKMQFWQSCWKYSSKTSPWFRPMSRKHEKKFFFAESKSFKKFSCTLRIQFCQACQENFAIVLIMFQLMSKTDRVFFLQKICKMFLWTRKAQFWRTCRKFLNKKPQKVSLNNENDLNNTIFLKKKFFRDKLNAVLTSQPKSIFTERRKTFSSRSEDEAIFLEKKRQIFFGTIRMHFW